MGSYRSVVLNTLILLCFLIEKTVLSSRQKSSASVADVHFCSVIASEGERVMLVRVADIQCFNIFGETGSYNQSPCNVCS